jgi:hypothetical protein
MDETVARVLDTADDARSVVTDPDAEYFGTVLEVRSLVPDGNARLTPTRLDEWLEQQ